MVKYIEREAAINRIKEYALDVYSIDLDDAKQFSGHSRRENYCEGLYEATELVDDIPAADVVPVVHGRWVSVAGKRDRICSRCLRNEPYKNADDAAEVFEFCPHCGAKMDGGDCDALN